MAGRSAGGADSKAPANRTQADVAPQLERRARELAGAGGWADAERLYLELARLRPADGGVFHNLGVCQLHQGRVQEAAQSHWNAAIRTPERTDFWLAFGELFRRLRFNGWNAELQHMAVACLTHPELDPAPYRQVAGSVARSSPALSPFMVSGLTLTVPQLQVLAENPLLEALLRNTVAPDLLFERLVGCIRVSLLGALESCEDPGSLVDLAISIAMQSQLTNYLLPVTSEEASAVDELTSLVATWVSSDQPLPSGPQAALTWAVLASYRPVNTVNGTDVAEKEPEELGLGGVEEFWARLVVEPALREAMARVVPQLSAPEPGVSSEVALQYEDHPYPRWLRVDRGAVEPAERALVRMLPGLSEEDVACLKAPRVLIAGCGTGKQALDAVRRLAASEVIAVDLSRASLGYAATGAWKADEDRIRFLQADILTLGEWDERFDVVEAGGVLHHLADPLEGWRILLGLLKPGGLMKLGLYSRRARRPVEVARGALAEAGFDSAPGAIRQGRDWLGENIPPEAYDTITGWRDFYSLDECRDLLFHAQEQTYDLLQVAQILRKLGLRFLGFEGLEPRALEAFDDGFGLDRILDLEAWDELEQAQPGAFSGMYQFWVSR
ncbi:MAG: methyltransferase domain-containing protein [Longimicrobiales bacterium]